MMVLYGLVFYETMTWFMALEALIMRKLGFVSVVVGAGVYSVWIICERRKSSKIQKVKTHKWQQRHYRIQR